MASGPGHPTVGKEEDNSSQEGGLLWQADFIVPVSAGKSERNLESDVLSVGAIGDEQYRSPFKAESIWERRALLAYLLLSSRANLKFIGQRSARMPGVILSSRCSCIS